MRRPDKIFSINPHKFLLFLPYILAEPGRIGKYFFRENAFFQPENGKKSEFKPAPWPYKMRANVRYLAEIEKIFKKFGFCVIKKEKLPQLNISPNRFHKQCLFCQNLNLFLLIFAILLGYLSALAIII